MAAYSYLNILRKSLSFRDKLVKNNSLGDLDIFSKYLDPRRIQVDFLGTLVD